MVSYLLLIHKLHSRTILYFTQSNHISPTFIMKSLPACFPRFSYRPLTPETRVVKFTTINNNITKVRRYWIDKFVADFPTLNNTIYFVSLTRSESPPPPPPGDCRRLFAFSPYMPIRGIIWLQPPWNLYTDWPTYTNTLPLSAIFLDSHKLC